MHADAKTDLI